MTLPGSRGRMKQAIGRESFAPIPWVYGEIVRHLSRVEKVRILVPTETRSKKRARSWRKCGADMAAVEFFRVPTDRSWTRDYCPIFVARRSTNERF